MVAPRVSAEIKALASAIKQRAPYLSAAQLTVLRKRRAKLKKRVDYVKEKIKNSTAQRRADQLNLNL